MTIRTYTELMQFSDFKDRFEYLKLSGRVGADTFGFDRWLNQQFYRSKEWKKIRQQILIRDNGFDLAHPEHPIAGRVIIHHLNPITAQDLEDRSDLLLNPEFLITTMDDTHNAIHYGDSSLLPSDRVIERRSGDTVPWR